MLRKRIAFIVAALLLTPCTGCRSSLVEDESAAETAVSAEPTQSTTESAAETTQPATEAISFTGINPLTGEDNYPESAEGKRPVAVMVSNIEASYPQYGISEADLIFEMPVEGGLTRLMAVYADYTSVPDICSVRSCRYYYPQVAMGLDAVYCHWGAEQNFAVETLNSLGIDHFDGGYLQDTILFYRDPERIGSYSSEHTGYLKGSELPEAFALYGIRETSTKTGNMMQFSESTVLPEEACTGAVLYYSNSSYTGFGYSTKTEEYEMTHNSQPQVDGNTEEQLSFKNVFILQTTVSSLQEDGYLKSVALSGGDGYYLTMGAYQSIRWEKKSDTDPIRFYGMDGEELLVNTGKSYIAIIGKGRPLEFSAE